MTRLTSACVVTIAAVSLLHVQTGHATECWWSRCCNNLGSLHESTKSCFTVISNPFIYCRYVKRPGFVLNGKWFLSGGVLLSASANRVMLTQTWWFHSTRTFFCWENLFKIFTSQSCSLWMIQIKCNSTKNADLCYISMHTRWT